MGNWLGGWLDGWQDQMGIKLISVQLESGARLSLAKIKEERSQNPALELVQEEILTLKQNQMRGKTVKEERGVGRC